MMTTEREALCLRIRYMYYRLAHSLKEMDRDRFSGIPDREGCRDFHRCRNRFFSDLERFEKEDLNETLSAAATSAPLNDVRDLDRLLEETLGYWEIPTTLLSVEALLRPNPLRGCRVENVRSEDRLIPAGEEGYWLLTREGYLEFHGGGYLRNEYGPISLDYGSGVTVGSDGIETGLLKIFNNACPPEGSQLNGRSTPHGGVLYSRADIIEAMLDGGLNYYVNGDNINERNCWYWDLRDNLDYRENRRIRLPERVRSFYAQFEPGWKRVEGGFIGADYRKEKSADARYHVGVDWVWRCNNRNSTAGVPILSTTDGVVISSRDEGGRIGNAVRILCDDGAEIDYFHLGSLLPGLKTKDGVVRGQLIGYGGGSGTADAHLHIAKSYLKDSDFSEKKLSESKYDGHQINEGYFLLYLSKKTGKPLNDRAYVIPPEPLTRN